MTKEEIKVEEESEEDSSLTMSRRTFIKLAGAAGAGAAAFGYLKFSPKKLMMAGAEPDPNEGDTGVTTVRSFCLMCHSDCGLQAKIKDGVIVKLDGNPYHPANNDYSVTGTLGSPAEVTETNVDFDSATDVGTLCPKGQAGIMTMYDPYRVRSPLKRDGPRGSGRWAKVGWKDALDQIITGTGLPSGSGTAGLTAIRGDPSTDNMPTADIYDVNEADPGAGSPEEYFGPQANQLLFFYGRNMQKDFTKRFVQAYGTKNHHGHTSICEATQKVAHETTFRNATAYDLAGDDGFPIKGKDHFKPDIKGCENLVVAGAAYLEANFPMQALARYSMEAIESGLKVWSINPRFTRLAGKGHNWIPVKPGGDAALGMGLIRHIITEIVAGNYPKDFLLNPNALAAANELSNPGGSTGEAFTDACFLVRADTGKYVLDSDVLVGTDDVPVVWNGSAFVAFNEASLTAALPPASLTHSTQFDFGSGNVDVKTTFLLLKEQSELYTMAQYNDMAGLTGLTGKEIGDIGDFLLEGATGSDYGKRTAIDYYKGPSQQTAAFSACRAYTLVNVLLGNIDKKGGLNAGGGHYSYSKPGGGVDNSGGIYIDRHGKTYKGAGTPARQWFPFASHGVCQDIWPSVKMGYPYKTKAVFQYYQDFVYTYPYNQIVREAILEEDGAGNYKVPLIMSFDAFMGESSALGDYILPDTCFLERWTVYHSHPTVKTKVTAIRQPVLQGNIRDVTIAGHGTKVYVSPMSTLTGNSFATVNDFLDAFDGPMVMDDMLICLANKMNLPGYGDDAMGAAGKHLYTAWDYWDEWAKSGDLGEGLEPSTMDYMAIGGQYQDPSDVYEDAPADNLMRNRYKKVCTLYVEQMAGKFNALNGADEYPALPVVEGLKDISGADIDDESDGYDFLLISHKAVQHTQSRTGQNPWLMQLQPENWAEMNKEDADALGVTTGDWIRIASPTNLEGVKIKVKVSQHIRKKTIDVPWGWGHWEFGSKPYYVDGTSSGSDSLLGRGWNVNSLMRADPFFYDDADPVVSGAAAATTDRIGGSANQYVNYVKVRRG